MRKIYLVLILSGIWLGACRKAHYTYEPASATPVSKDVIFITFTVQRDSITGSSKIELTGKRIIEDQKLKTEPSDSDSENKMVIKQLDSGSRELSSAAVDHPLMKRAEGMNKRNELETQMVKVDKAEFFVRLTLLAETEYIRVDEVVGGKNAASVTFKIKD